MFAGMTAYNLYRKILEQIKGKYDVSEADSITSLIFESITGMNRSAIAREPQLEVSESTEALLLQALNRIRAGEPVQYVTGESWFYKHKFIIRPGALIPRPETEELVQQLVDSADKSKLHILDIGTGSGCIAISIKKALPDCLVTAVDVSEEALDIARENARLLKADIALIQMDFLKKEENDRLGVYDRIISNPPYIPLHERNSLDEHVREHEPEIALFVPDNRPLIFYEAIADFAGSHLSPSGMIFLEIHEPFAEMICDILRKKGFTTETIKDLFGKVRMIRAIRCR